MSSRHLRRVQSKHALLLAALTAGGAAIAADVPPLPADFLEYLGSWEAEDADWLVASAAAVATAPTASTVAPLPTNPMTNEQRGAARSPATTEHKP